MRSFTHSCQGCWRISEYAWHARGGGGAHSLHTNITAAAVRRRRPQRARGRPHNRSAYLKQAVDLFRVALCRGGHQSLNRQLREPAPPVHDVGAVAIECAQGRYRGVDSSFLSRRIYAEEHVVCENLRPLFHAAHVYMLHAVRNRSSRHHRRETSSRNEEQHDDDDDRPHVAARKRSAAGANKATLRGGVGT